MNGFSKTVNSVVTYPPDLEFEYDAMGQRVLKIVKTRDAAGLKPQADWKYTYYVRDAAGNVLTTYNRTITVDQTNAAYRIDKYKVEEWTMYGSSRLGIQKPSGEGVVAAELKFEPEQNNTYTVISRTATTIPTTSLLRKAGEKIYELSNHLGNVLVTVSDRVLPVVNPNAVAQTLYYSADVKSASDYSAFGAPLSGRISNASTYRYGMNGQEKDEELGSGVTTADYWEYDAKLGRRWNVDPVVKPWRSCYDTYSNNPITRIDPRGNDDYYDKLGRYLGSDNSKTNNIRIITSNDIVFRQNFYLDATNKIINSDVGQANSQTLSSFTYGQSGWLSSDANLRRIANKYSRELNLRAPNGSITKVKTKKDVDDKGNAASIAFVISEEGESAIYITFNNNGQVSELINDINNLKSVLVHENLHQQYKGEENDISHINIYIDQMAHETYLPTTSEFKEGMATNVVDYLNKLIKEGFNVDLLEQDQVKRLNDLCSTTGYIYIYDKDKNEYSKVKVLTTVEITGKKLD